jgi:lysophospholipase L1-like esterase
VDDVVVVVCTIRDTPGGVVQGAPQITLGLTRARIMTCRLIQGRVPMRSPLGVLVVLAAVIVGWAIPANAQAPSPTAIPTSAAATEGPGLVLVAVGDSIPFNSPDDCPGCTGFVARYADAVAAATGEPVTVRNLSEHNNQVVDGLLRELDSDQLRIDALADADIIVVGIAHNDVPMNRDDDSCDGPYSEFPDWSKFTDECIATEVARFSPGYAAVFKRIAALRAGKPTVLRTIDGYNDWIGWPGHDLPQEGIAATAAVIAAWNEMICTAAEASGFLCADISTAFNGPDGTQPSGDLLAGDYTHPSDKGNEAIAQALIDLGFAPLAE